MQVQQYPTRLENPASPLGSMRRDIFVAPNAASASWRVSVTVLFVDAPVSLGSFFPCSIPVRRSSVRPGALGDAFRGSGQAVGRSRRVGGGLTGCPPQSRPVAGLDARSLRRRKPRWRPGISVVGNASVEPAAGRARTVAIPDPAVSGAPARPAGHRPLDIRPGRRHGSPPVSRSQAARAAAGPLMRTFSGQLRTAPGRFAGGGAGGGAGFRSSPPATSERDHSTR